MTSTAPNRGLVAAEEGHLYFGTSWSPDGKAVLYVDCTPGNDPGHDWADVCTGPEHKVWTQGGAMWFAATYGDPKTRGGGSNVPAWTRSARSSSPGGCPARKSPGNTSPQRPDLDHFNRDFKPEAARGGTEICRLNLRDGSTKALTSPGPRSGTSGPPSPPPASTSPSAVRKSANLRALGHGPRRPRPAPAHTGNRRPRGRSPPLALEQPQKGTFYFLLSYPH